MRVSCFGERQYNQRGQGNGAGAGVNSALVTKMLMPGSIRDL